MLLRELIKHTSPKHPDYQNLNSAAEKIEKVVSVVNDRKKEDEKLSEMVEVRNTFALTEVSL